MTDKMQPQQDDGNIRERLTALETGLHHFQQISEMQDRQIREAFERVRARNDKQDSNLETLEERLILKIEAIYGLLWSGMKWGGGLLAVTLLSVVLKALNLV